MEALPGLIYLSCNRQAKETTRKQCGATWGTFVVKASDYNVQKEAANDSFFITISVFSAAPSCCEYPPPCLVSGRTCIIYFPIPQLTNGWVGGWIFAIMHPHVSLLNDVLDLYNMHSVMNERTLLPSNGSTTLMTFCDIHELWQRCCSFNSTYIKFINWLAEWLIWNGHC